MKKPKEEVPDNAYEIIQNWENKAEQEMKHGSIDRRIFIEQEEVIVLRNLLYHLLSEYDQFEVTAMTYDHP